MNKEIKIGVLLYTYNRTDDARINMEIIRNVWSKKLSSIKIVHSFNGKKEWWPEKYLEDELLYLDNPGHFEGAELLINEGIKCFYDKFSDVDYVFILASDTWLVKPEYVENLINKMSNENKYMATCPWGTLKKDNMWNIGISLDLNVIDLRWAKKYDLFPIGYKDFISKFGEVFMYSDEVVYPERVFAVRFKQAVLRANNIPSENIFQKVVDSCVYRMKEREPVHDEPSFWGIKKGRKMYWSKIGLLTHHDPIQKQKDFKKWPLELGDAGKKFITANDLSYFNDGFKHTYIKKENGVELGYRE